MYFLAVLIFLIPTVIILIHNAWRKKHPTDEDAINKRYEKNIRDIDIDV